jgi:hypothetical protein
MPESGIIRGRTMKNRFQKLALVLAIFASVYQINAATVFPIINNPGVEELSGGIAASGTNYLVGFLSGSSTCFQMVSTNGSLQGSAVTIGSSTGEPWVAASKSCYLVVWYNNTSTLGQIVSFNGTLVGSAFTISSIEVFGLASDGTNFLVVLDDNGYNNNYYVYGQLVTSAGTLSGPGFLISSQVANGKEDGVAFGRTNYLVAWMSQNVADNGNTNLAYGALVTPSGSAGSPFQIGQTTAPDQSFLEVAFDGTNYLAAWMWDPYPETGETVTNWNIYGRLVSQAGTFPGAELHMVTDAGNDGFPALAFDGNNYLLSWAYGFQVITNTNIRFQFFNRTGSAVTPEFTLFTNEGTNAPLGDLNGLVFDGRQYAAVATIGPAFFSCPDIYAGFLSASFSLQPPRITSFQRNGSLTWTNTPGTNLFALQSIPDPVWIDSSGTYAFVLQWAASLTGSWSYAAPPLDLTISTNIQMTVSAPAAPGTGFYRLLEGFGAQTFHGAWLGPQTGTTNVGGIYVMPDGNGTVTNVGFYNPLSPPGSYGVSYDGAISFIFDSSNQTFAFSGQFTPPDDIAITGSATNMVQTFVPVENVSLCAGSWNGTLTETNDPNGLHDYPVTLTVATNGFVNLSGSFSGTGWTFALATTNGACCGFFHTGTGFPYDQFQLNGTLTGNTISGLFNTDSGSGADAVSGNFTLTR